MSKKLIKELIDEVDATIKAGDTNFKFKIVRPDPKKEKKILKEYKKSFVDTNNRELKIELKKVSNKEHIINEKLKLADEKENLKLLDELEVVYDEQLHLVQREKESFLNEYSIEEFSKQKVLNHLDPDSHQTAEDFAEKYGFTELRNLIDTFWAEAMGNN